MKKHNFIISSTRPELLSKQITSFLNIREGRKLGFYVFNDDESRNNEFMIEINKLKLIPHANIFYFNIEKQIKIIKDIASKYSKILGVNKEIIINCFKENGKLRGIRSIQNKSIFIFYSKNKDIESIVHRLDDDIFPYEAHRHTNTIEIVIKHDFFKKKEASINNDVKIISGNNYTIDSPSPLVNYIDFVEFLFNFYKIAKNKYIDSKIGKDILKISPASVKKIYDPFKTLDILPIDQDFTYKEAVNAFEKYAKLIESGDSRVIINDNKENRNGFNKFFPGGCVSFIYKNFPTLTPNFGNQDLLWELIEIIDGKMLLTDGYIGHIKSQTQRVSIVNDLKDSSYKHQTAITYSVFKYLIAKNNNNYKLLNFQKDFIDLMDKWLYEANHYSNQIIHLLNNKNAWYADEFNFSSTILVKKICSDFINSYEEIKSNFSQSTENINLMMSNYYKDKKIFDKLIKQITADC